MPIRLALAVVSATLACACDLAAQQSTRRTWVIPHVLEKEGRIADTRDTYDFDLHIVSSDRGAVVEVSVHGEDGQPMRSRTGQPVCSPCRVTFAGGPKQVFSLEERIVAAGGFPRELVSGYLVITASGAGEGASARGGHFLVNQGMQGNSHASGRSVFMYYPEEVRSRP